MRFLIAAAALLLAPLPLHAEDAAPPPATPTAATAANASPEPWAFTASDIPVDPGYRFGQLANGMRYIIRHNDRPEGTGQVRLRIGSGSLAERDDERGLAHFLEHMAFNGSTHVPEGEMVKLLEREGLAFGADTNASTDFEQTLYKLDLPRNDPALLDTALMLMRETASELTLAPEAIDRERGVVLAERRDRSGYAQRELEDRFAFLTPGARYTSRMPIGVPEVLESAGADRLRRYYAREYVPANAVLVVVGDFDPALVEQKIRTRFADWQAAPRPNEPDAGPVDVSRKGKEEVYLDPALSERVIATRLAPYVDQPDTSAERRQNLLRSIGYGIINRRLARLARAEDAPFRSAGFGSTEFFKAARATNLVIDSADGGWARGLDAAVKVLRSALAFGFSQAEIDEQLAEARTAQENAVTAARTRNNGGWTEDALALVSDEVVPSTAASSLERFNRFAPYITPAAVLAALEDDAVPLDDPLLRFQGRTAPDGGAAALRTAWNAAMAGPVEQPVAATAAKFAYDDFGPPGTVVSDRTEPVLGIREIRFANGVMLNLKPTTLAEDRIAFSLNVDGGDLLNTRDNPLATALVSWLAQGGLGKQTLDELQSLLAGHSTSFALGSGPETFATNGTTTRRDLALQLNLLAALVTDPGYRPDAEERFRRAVANYYKSLGATPGSALSAGLGAILSDNDPRFSLAPEAALAGRTFHQLKGDIGDRLAHGAIELALVGDFDPAAAIALVARTFGALPAREPAFLPHAEARQRSFTADRSAHVLTHRGDADQALLRLTWPTRDDSDLAAAAQLELLERVTQLELTEELREKLGKAYSPSASSDLSRTYPGYGTFSITASVDVKEVPAARAAIAAVTARLAATPVDQDTLRRAREPLLEAFDNALKTNAGWLALADRAQSRPQDISRYAATRAALLDVTAEDVRDAAARYLGPDQGVEVLVVPEGAAGTTSPAPVADDQ